MYNILTTFKKEIGFTTASIQYTELAVRIASEAFGEQFEKDGVTKIAKSYNLNVACIPDDFSVRVAKNYIVQIYSCLESFLNNYKKLVGSASYNSCVLKDDNLLHWTLLKAFGDKSDKNDLYQICDYYRNVRNLIIHNGKDTTEYKHLLYVVSKMHTDKLKAPNSIEKIQFDDQVLFARSAFNIAKSIFYGTDYNWEEVLRYYNNDISKIKKGCENRDKHIRKVVNFLMRAYPIAETDIEKIKVLL